MKKFLLFISVFFLLATATRAQYFTLEGRQFKDGNGHDFYPVVCNFTADYLFSSSQRVPFFPSPSKNHDGTCYECNSPASCLNQFTANFKQIKKLKFNAIRLYMMNPGFYNKAGDSTHGWAVKALDLDFLNSVKCWTSKGVNEYTRPIYLSPTFGMDANLALLFSYYDSVLLRAARESLTVLLDIGVATGSYSPVFMENYEKYLALVGKHFASESTPDSVRQAILAYVILEEPSVSMDLRTLWPAVTEGQEKQDIGKYFARWYDTLKRNDPHHLITMGFTPYDFFEFDPGVLKLDFASPHIYPLKQDYEGTAAFQGMTDQVQGWFYWLASTLPIPYLVGETGFRSKYMDDTHIGNQGTNLQQRIYAERSLQSARDCKASGYSWWYYQDYWWGNPTECFWGVLGRNLKTLKTEEKPVAKAFRNFNASASPGSFSPADSYYDPYHHAYYAARYGYDQSHYLHGHVLDQDGNPVRNAYVRGQTRLSGKGASIKLSNHHTFTDADGNFVLIPFDYEPDKEPNYNVIETLYITAPGYSRFHTESWGPQGVKDPVTVRLERIKN